MQVPISVTAPGWISREQGVAALGAAGGVLFSDFMASTLTARYALTGGTSLAASALTKGVLGVAGFWGAGKMTGLARTGLWLGSVGCFASIALDVIKTYIWTGAEVAGARLRASYRPYRVPVRPPVRVRPPVAVPMVPRVETPSAEVLGGF